MVMRNVKDGHWQRKFILCKRLRLRSHGAHSGGTRRVWFTSVERRYLGGGVWTYREAAAPIPSGLVDEPGWFSNARAPLAVYGCGCCIVIFIGLAIFGPIRLIGSW